MSLRTAPATQPTPAERMLTIVTAAHSMTVVADGRPHEIRRLDSSAAMGRLHLHDPGQPSGACPAGSVDGAAGHRVPMRVEFTDIAPTSVRDRVRGRVTLTGLVAAPYDPESTDSACLELGQAVYEDAEGRTHVTLDELNAVEPDPMAGSEAAMLHHLVTDHADLVTLLLRLVPSHLKHGLTRALPLAIDRYGITLRLEHPTGGHTTRLPFAKPLTHTDQAGTRIHALMAAARRASHSHLGV
ncbi:DUF2470 domain-containing protein [Streptomyces sp. NPDC097619]|uniref:DUF2470 domain-containing protein n=1 Tax=Streptomyces sp. NPDC097619 TaxID=3157228 RepID=UPI003317EFF1